MMDMCNSLGAKHGVDTMPHVNFIFNKEGRINFLLLITLTLFHSFYIKLIYNYFSEGRSRNILFMANMEIFLCY
jgi:hypothetical protein